MNEFELNKKKHFSFIIVTPSGKKSVQLRIPLWLCYSILTTLIMLIIIISSSLYYVSSSSYQIKTQKTLKEQTKNQAKQLTILDKELNNLAQQFHLILKEEQELKHLIGVEKSNYYTKKKLLKKISNLKKEFPKTTNQALPPQIIAAEKILFLKKQVQSFTPSFKKLSRKIVLYKKRFDATPSTWPLYGYIRSDFGWRIHPISQRREFHKGLDIPAWIGAPIKATADGVIIYAGWAGGYGLVIIIDHGYGFRTVYAHASKLLGENGELVKKGQVIANVGSTGISTGPHIHYEITRWGKATNPKKHLQLDLFTASTRIW
jgi:murein DD-endopeptidase MepM/ murein hydrolase activator NlpD